PSPGVIGELELDAGHDRYIRVETGYRAGDCVPVFYDPLVAKIVAWGDDRESCIARLRAHLSQVKIKGIRTNVGFLCSLLGHPELLAANLHTGFIEAQRRELLSGATSDKVLS